MVFELVTQGHLHFFAKRVGFAEVGSQLVDVVTIFDSDLSCSSWGDRYLDAHECLLLLSDLPQEAWRFHFFEDVSIIPLSSKQLLLFQLLLFLIKNVFPHSRDGSVESLWLLVAAPSSRRGSLVDYWLERALLHFLGLSVLVRLHRCLNLLRDLLFFVKPALLNYFLCEISQLLLLLWLHGFSHWLNLLLLNSG